jgi:hypothetical protein
MNGELHALVDAVALVAICSGMERRELMPSRSHYVDGVEHPFSETPAAPDVSGLATWSADAGG